MPDSFSHPMSECLSSLRSQPAARASEGEGEEHHLGHVRGGDGGCGTKFRLRPTPSKLRPTPDLNPGGGQPLIRTLRHFECPSAQLGDCIGTTSSPWVHLDSSFEWTSSSRKEWKLVSINSCPVPIRNEVAARQSPLWVNFFSTCLL